MTHSKELSQSKACKRLRGVGLSKNQALGILNEVQKWVASSGTEWTIKRLKSLKVAYINKLAGSDEPFKHAPWITYANGIPKGPFGMLFKISKVQKALSALMVYSEYISNKPTKQQLAKFVNAVTSPFLGDTDSTPHIYQSLMDEMINVVRSSDTSYIKNIGHSHPETFSVRKVRIPAVVTEMVDPKGSSRRYHDVLKSKDNNMEDFVDSFSHPYIERYYQHLPDLPKGIEEIMTAIAFRGDSFDDLDDSLVGRIGFIQEPGYKLRTIANPLPSIQVALSRLGNKIYEMLKHIPEDCTFNQESAVLDTQEFLRKNSGSDDSSRLMSIDLSSATDRFPLEAQEVVLATLARVGIIDSVDISLFQKVSRSEWLMPGGSETISWKVGQPLGVFPSFGVFALTHNLLARSVKPTFYRVLGDDIIIDYDSGVKLRQLYTELGLVISEDKSITSNSLAEFGGRLIMANQSFVQPKWKDISDRSFIELAKNLGPKSLKLFKPRQQKILKLLAEVHPDVHPWGLNWNVKGEGYEARITHSKQVMQHFLETDNDLISFSRNQVELQALRWSTQVKEFYDFKCHLKDDSYFTVPLASRLFGDLTIGKPDSVKTLSGEFLDQFDLSVEDAVLAKTKTDFIRLCKDAMKPTGFNVASIGSFSDPRGETTLSVAERKLVKAKFPTPKMGTLNI
jgi:hypothetical protein